MEFSTFGIPILTLQEKLDALDYCVKGASWEDVAGHLCDLLELARTKIEPSVGLPFADLHEMVGKYGKHPTPITEPQR